MEKVRAGVSMGKREEKLPAFVFVLKDRQTSL